MNHRTWAGCALAVAITTLMAGCAATGRLEGAGASGVRDGALDGVHVAAAAMTPNEASNAALLRTVQQALNDKGFDAGEVDGRWGTATEYALRRFQLAQRLPPTGDLDSVTMAALGVCAPAGVPTTATAEPNGTRAPNATSNGASTRALPYAGTAQNTTALPPPMTPTGTTPAGMTTPGATPSGVATRPAAGTPAGAEHRHADADRAAMTLRLSCRLH